jgi:hypothetical protein
LADIYHIWCNPKEGVDSADFANKIKIFLGELIKAGKLQSFRVMRMKLQAANRGESPTTLLAQFKRIQQQTVQTEDGQSLNGITEINPAQKSLFNALELKSPTPNNLLTSSL